MRPSLSCCSQGSNARDTNRTEKGGAKALIKTNQTTMKIELHLANRGLDAFQHDKFGDLIIIEKKVSQTVRGNPLCERAVFSAFVVQLDQCRSAEPCFIHRGL